MNDKEKKFYDGLSSVPPLPDSIYPAVRERIRQRTVIARLGWTLAAAVVLAIGLSLLPVMKKNVPTGRVTLASSQVSQRTDDAIYDDLEVAHEYINGNSIEDELSQYGIGDLSIF